LKEVVKNIKKFDAPNLPAEKKIGTLEGVSERQISTRPLFPLFAK
jgi:hypothetical protein